MGPYGAGGCTTGNVVGSSCCPFSRSTGCSCCFIVSFITSSLAPFSAGTAPPHSMFKAILVSQVCLDLRHTIRPSGTRRQLQVGGASDHGTSMSKVPCRRVHLFASHMPPGLPPRGMPPLSKPDTDYTGRGSRHAFPTRVSSLGQDPGIHAHRTRISWPEEGTAHLSCASGSRCALVGHGANLIIRTQPGAL